VADTEVRSHYLGARRAAPVATPRGAFRAIQAALGALRRWWAGGRRYRPERRYMRGGQPRAARVLAERR
jgi:hypothetical protein